MAKKKIAPKRKSVAGKPAKKPSAKNPVSKAVKLVGRKAAPAKAKAKVTKPAPPAKKKPQGKPAAIAKKAVVPAKKAAPIKPVKGAKTPTKPVAKAIAKPAPKPVAKVVVAPKPALKLAAKEAPKGPQSTKAVAPVPTKASPASPAVAPNAAAKEAQKPAVKTPVFRKRPAKERVVMEFYLRSTPTALYELISNPSGFSEWYCDDVDVRGDQYTFIWDQEQEVTTLIGRKLGEVIRFRRNEDEDPEAFFEFRVRIDAMTNETALVVTDHAWPNEVDKTRNLWTAQIASLQRVLGA